MRPDESNTMLSGEAPVVKIGVTDPDTVSMRTRVPGLVNKVPKTVAARVCALASSESMTTNTPRRTAFRWDMVRLLFFVLRGSRRQGHGRPAACGALRRLSAVAWSASIDKNP